MPKPIATRVFPFAGYELRRFEEGIGMRLIYVKGDPSGTDAEDRKTPMLVLLSEEARAFARDILELADKIDAATAKPPDEPLH